MNIFKELTYLIAYNTEDFISYLSYYSDYCSIKYNFNEEHSGDNLTFFTLKPQATKESPRVQTYVLFTRKKEYDKEIYEVAQLATIDKTYLTILTEIINTYKNSIENNYFL